jgi:type II secretory pathway component GspD/PulD (secretin)
LGDVPLIRYLFSQESKEVNDQEVLVMLTPRVIRLPEPTAAEGSGVALGTLGGGEEHPGSVESPRTIENPSPEPRQP